MQPERYCRMFDDTSVECDNSGWINFVYCVATECDGCSKLKDEFECVRCGCKFHGGHCSTTMAPLGILTTVS